MTGAYEVEKVLKGSVEARTALWVEVLGSQEDSEERMLVEMPMLHCTNGVIRKDGMRS